MNTKSIIRIGLVGGLALSLSGCASFTGQGVPSDLQQAIEKDGGPGAHARLAAWYREQAAKERQKAQELQERAKTIVRFYDHKGTKARNLRALAQLHMQTAETYETEAGLHERQASGPPRN